MRELKTSQKALYWLFWIVSTLGLVWLAKLLLISILGWK